MWFASMQILENEYVPQWVVDRFVETKTEAELIAYARMRGVGGPGPMNLRDMFDEELQHARERRDFHRFSPSASEKEEDPGPPVSCRSA